MAFPDDYTPNTCRKLPLDYNIRNITDGDDLLSKLDDIYSMDMVTAAKGEVLLLAAGQTYDVVVPGDWAYENLQIGPGSHSHHSEDYFACICDEDPKNPAIINLTQDNGTTDDGVTGFYPKEHSAFYGTILNFSSSYAVGNGKFGVPLMTLSTACKVAGVRFNDVSVPNAQAGALIAYGFFAGPPTRLVNNAVLATASLSIGDGGAIGMFFLSDTGGLCANNTIRHSGLAYGMYLYAATVNSVNNVVEDAITGDFGEDATGGGSFSQTTPCDGCGDMSFAVDGYTLTASDAGNGTDTTTLDPAFDDDINGDRRLKTAPERGAEAYEIMDIDIIKQIMTRVSSRVGPGASVLVGADLSNRING
jgi:hypothetical protein